MVKHNWRVFPACMGMALIIFFLAACDSNVFVADDLTMARKAVLERDWPVAERLLERYLRHEQNSQKRWEAWRLMLQALNAESSEPRASIECLEAMRIEFENDESKLAWILMQMGRYNALARRYARAVDAFAAYVDLGSLTNQERVEGYRRLAAMQFNQRHFDAGEETLQECLGLPLPDQDKIHCMLDLADANMTREKWQDVADLCLQIQETGADEAVLGVAGYLRGDALEQMGQTEEALAQFEAARDKYPNSAVMDNRIEHLKKMIKKSGQEKK